MPDSKKALVTGATSNVGSADIADLKTKQRQVALVKN